MRRLTLHPAAGHPYFAGAPLLIAHRGGSALAPENTLLALRRAADWWRADILEIDVHPTRDGEAVVIHDPTVDRTTDGRGPVAGFTLEQLHQFDAGFRFTPDGGKSFPFRGRDERIPTLRQVLVAFPSLRINIEIKDPRAQAPVWDVVHDANAAGRVLIAAGTRRHRSAFRSYTGPVSASSTELYSFLVLLRSRLARCFPAVIDAFQMPERHAGRQVLSPEWIRAAHARNIPVHVWTIDERADMRRLLEWGVDGIVTDRPDRLGAVLHEQFGRPLPPGPPDGESEPFLERLLRI